MFRQASSRSLLFSLRRFYDTPQLIERLEKAKYSSRSGANNQCDFTTMFVLTKISEVWKLCLLNFQLEGFMSHFQLQPDAQLA